MISSSSQHRWIALFPGQGSQFVGMGRELTDNFKIARETLEEASDAIQVNLKKLCFEGPEDALILTENTQPCLLAVSVAAFRATQSEMELKPEAFAGHSLGEYSALVAAGSLPLADAIRWVRARGKAMQEAVPPGQGTMAAVLNLDDARIEVLCTKATELAKARRANPSADSGPQNWTVDCLVQPANFNSLGQTVIAGSKDAIDEAIALVKTDADFKGGKAVPLAVSAPFHSALMRPARERMAGLFQKAAPAARPAAAYVPNRTARLTHESGVIYELLIEQVDRPVLWRQTMETVLGAGFTHAVEFGPGKVLQGLAKRITGPQGTPLQLAGVSDLAGLKALETFLRRSP